MELEVKVDQDGFKGSALMKVEPFAKRVEMLKKLSLKSNDEGEIEVDSDGGLDKSLEIRALAKSHILKIELKHKSGLKVTDVDSLECYQEGESVLNTLSGYVLNGVKLSKD